MKYLHYIHTATPFPHFFPPPSGTNPLRQETPYVAILATCFYERKVQNIKIFRHEIKITMEPM
jgi:hypothetical protein